MSETVALLGLGTMGSGMAKNLLKAGFALTVWNRTQAKAHSLADKGATIAATPAEAVRGNAIVLSMLADDAASRDVWLGIGGALAAADQAAVLIESSTVSPTWIAELSGAAAARGVAFLDAPVTGSRVHAADAQLTFLVGGSPDALEKATPVLKAMSKNIVHLGPTGSGAKLKLINNFLCGVQIASLAEGLTWLERSGLDREKALNFLKAGAPGSPVVSGLSARMTDRNYDVNFLLKLMNKDLQYAENEAAAEHVELKTAAVARSLFEEAVAQGFGEQDMSAVIEPLRKKQ